jgi:adenine deaminase
MVTIPQFAHAVLPNGTTSVVIDPHEIANVLGIMGIQYMVDEAKRTPLDIFYMVPSCVPVSSTDCGGAELKWTEVALLKDKGNFLGLGEVMNINGVFKEDEDIWHKLSLFRIIDGHAPLLSSRKLDAYICAGIQSDHESTSAEEATEKLRKGMYVMIREGSIEANLKVLIRTDYD